MQTYELLPEQKKLWDMERIYPSVGICNIGGYLHLEGKYNEKILQKTMEIFAMTNSSLWTKITEDGRIYIEEIKEYHVDICDYTHLSNEEADRIIYDMICTPFELYGGYMFEFKVLKLRDKTVVFEKFHHIIADGYSVALCAKFQEKIYEQIENGVSEFETDRRYIDRLNDYNGREIEESEKNTDEDCSILENEFENSRFVTVGRGIKSADAGIVTENRFDYIKINEYCRKNRISVEALFYGCIGIYLCKLYSCDAVSVGRNLLNRGRYDMTMVALKVDTRNYVVKPDWNSSRVDYFAGLKKNLAKHARYTEEQCYNGKADIVVSYRPLRYLPAPSRGECREYMNSSVEVPIKFFINDDGKSIELQVKYQKELFGEKDIEKIISKILFVMKQVIDNPEESLDSIEIVDKNDYMLIEEYGRGQQWKYSMSLPERFLQMVQLHNRKTALIYKDKKYTYKDIYRMVLTAKKIIQDNCGRDKSRGRIVGICVDRTPWLPALIYGAWLSGYGFMPISPKDSEEREKKIQSECDVLICDEMIDRYRDYEVHDIDMVNDSIAEIHNIQTDVPAYYMYTSGTTGESKAVMIAHSSLCCRIEWMEEQFSGGTDVVMQKTRNTFDVSVWELVLPWAFGRKMCMLEDGMEVSPKDIDRCIRKNNVTMVHFVPAMFRFFLEYVIEHKIKYKDLKYIIVSGEALDAKLVKSAKEYLKDVEIYNLYGPTECTIDVSYYRCTGEEKMVPIGKPVYNTNIYILNERGDLLPPGEKGELAVTGELVGMGYFNMTQDARSGYCDMKGNNSVRMYRTGDMAYLGEDGYFYYEGRCDNQVKIRGMRVNPDEIENILNNNIPEAWNVVLCVDNRIVDFYTGNVTEQEIKNIAEELLPYYCIPSEYVKVENIPVGKHGKTDRNELLEIYIHIKDNETIEEEYSGIKDIRKKEEIMLKIACKCLKRRDIEVSTNLLDAGMDSLSTLEFVSACEDNGINIFYNQVYEKRCIRELAKQQYTMENGLVYLNDMNNKERKNILIFIPFAGGTPYHFNAIAQYLYDEKMVLAAVNMPFFIHNSIEEIAGNIVRILKQGEYKEIYLCGSCVGSALAVRLAALLGERLKGMLLCEALPYTGSKAGKSKTRRIIWDMMPDKALEKSLHLLRGKIFSVTKQMKKCFMADVRKSAQYLAKRERIAPKCSVIMLYGEEDMLTYGFRRKYERWRQWIDCSYKIYTYKHGKHFMTEDNPEVIARIIEKHFLT